MAASVDNLELNQDELIIQQQRQIEKEICETTPFVSSIQDLSVLDKEYINDPIYTLKLEDMKLTYSAIRKTRPDGNCFFRAFGYAYLEYLAKNKDDYEPFRKLAEESKDALVNVGFSQFTLEDFHDTFMSVVDKVAPKDNPEESLKELFRLFNDQGHSDYVVVYLRLITSGELQNKRDFYYGFLANFPSIEEFRRQEVEPMYKESDHVHVTALCKALKVGIRIIYMDRSVFQAPVNEDSKDNGKDKPTVFPHYFPPDDASATSGVEDPKIYLLYRPGHYDILYPRTK